MSALGLEIDIGILSKDEATMGRGPFSRDIFREREEDWMIVALYLAQGCRLRMAKMAPTDPNYFAENAARQTALTTAMGHVNKLRDRGYALTADLASMLRREGL